MPNFEPPNVLPHTELACYIFFDENRMRNGKDLCAERISPPFHIAWIFKKEAAKQYLQTLDRKLRFCQFSVKEKADGLDRRRMDAKKAKKRHVMEERTILEFRQLLFWNNQSF